MGRQSVIRLAVGAAAMAVIAMGQGARTLGQESAYKDAKLPVEARVKDLMSRRTLDEKVGQMVQGDSNWLKIPDVSKYFLGSVLSGGDSEVPGLPQKHLAPFHRAIEAAISDGAAFLLDRHSTVPARGVGQNQIELMNFQHSHLDKHPQVFSPPILIETYAEELAKRHPEVKVTVNASDITPFSAMSVPRTRSMPWGAWGTEYLPSCRRPASGFTGTLTTPST